MKSIEFLDEILVHPNNRIGYDQSQKNLEIGESYEILEEEVEEKRKIHTFNHDEGNNTRKCHDHPRLDSKISSIKIGSFIQRYQSIFLGTCYSCNNFGHKAVNYKSYEWNQQMTRMYLKNGECYACHTNGHIAQNSKSYMGRPYKQG